MVSVIIPARNEIYLEQTIKNVLENAEGEIEIIAVLDGYLPEPPITVNPGPGQSVRWIHNETAIGQRQSINKAARVAKGKYIMKLDAHCAVDKGFDVKLAADCEYDWTVIPRMRNLDVKTWKPKEIDDFKTAIRRGKLHDYMYIGINEKDELRTLYYPQKENKTIHQSKADILIDDTMSCMGCCFFMHKDRFWELEGCDEGHEGGWGQQGIEVSLKALTSGGSLKVNKNTWFAHWFRGSDGGFPYPISGNQIKMVRDYSKDLWLNNKWHLQIYPLSLIVGRFLPLSRWSNGEFADLKQREMKVERAGIYSIKNNVNGKVYVGSASNLARRFGEHLRRLRRKDHENKYLQSAWNKYGEAQFTFDIERFCMEIELLAYEQEVLDTYKGKLGWRRMYNLNPEASSGLGRKHTSESLALMSIKQSGTRNGFYGKTHSPESIAKIRESNNGNTAWNKGIPHSEETKQRISQANTGKDAWNKGLTKETDERVRGISEKLTGGHPFENKEHPKGMLGKFHSEETKKIIGARQAGIPKTEEHNKKNSEANKGKVFTEEHRNNLSIAMKKKDTPRNEKGQFINIDKFNPPGWTMNDDLTIVFYSANVISEKIMSPVVRSLKKHGYPIVSVTQEPMDLGTNIVVPKQRSLQNIYQQVLTGAKEAKTEYVALCEDDCLYVREHFNFRPKTFGYNLNRWNLHLEEGVYSYRKRPVLSQCIAHRATLIRNLEQRLSLADIPDQYCGEMGVYEKRLGMEEYPYETFETKTSNIVVCHKKNISGRKYIGKDAEPVRTLPVWGDIQYWLDKFNPKVKWGRGAKKQIRKQHSHIGSVILEVEDICKNRMDYCDPRKKESLQWFLKCFPVYLEKVIEYEKEGKAFTDEELESFEYYQYHLSKLNPKDKNPYTNKGKARCLFLMRDVVSLYRDIKENGLRNPLDMWRIGDSLVLHRGGRRLEIIRALGYRTIPCRVFKSRDAFIKLCPEREIVVDDSIHSIGMKQFQRLKERATDKYWVHTYTRLYDKHIGYLRPDAEKILELGVFRGASLLLWRDAFPKAHIYGVDWKKRPDWVMQDKEERITFLLGSQCDDEFMRTQVATHGQFDVIVDDAGHRGDEMTISFKILWDALKPGGWYVLEDLYGHYRKDRKSMMPLLKDMVDNLHLDLSVKAMHFYYNICFVEKM